MRHLSLVFHFNLVKTQMSALSREGLLEGRLQLTQRSKVTMQRIQTVLNVKAQHSVQSSVPLCPHPQGSALRKGARSAQA